MELKHGIAVGHTDASLLLECVDYRIAQLKSEIKARKLNPNQFKGAFRQLLGMKARLTRLRNGIVDPNMTEGALVEGVKE
ncbi:MAG: hypothetical protein HRT93_02890 [Piscirickettsiaceae bacterium]|nr:hypothetical protein [Piscirickettsiaceae bacterium]